ncbi:thioredoxin-dependent thiol peroxidase [Calditrichota bacterium GD2]
MKWLLSIAFILALSTLLFGGDILKTGSKAPDFELPDSEGKIHRLSDYRGKMVALYFYPKDFTPGCTAEACNLRDNYDALQKKGLVVLGVSFDKPEKHKAFKEKYQLPFPLLSDTTKNVADKYGAKGTFTGFLFAKRITYLIDEQGNVLHVFEKVNAGNHAQQILDFLGK